MQTGFQNMSNNMIKADKTILFKLNVLYFVIPRSIMLSLIYKNYRKKKSRENCDLVNTVLEKDS